MIETKSQLTQTLAASLLILLATTATADNLSFPSTEAEIVNALTPKLKPTLKRKGLGPPKGFDDIKSDTLKVGALIHFDFDSAAIKKKSYPLLREYAKALKGGLADAIIEIAGHTDSRGSKQYNKDLSKRRAQAVKDFLILGYEIAANRLNIKGHGETRPIEPNTTEVGRAKNRRVEFIRVGTIQ
jgi:outer membrane protein OmpA-like peptidoglycan-associated protein